MRCMPVLRWLTAPLVLVLVLTCGGSTPAQQQRINSNAGVATSDVVEQRLSVLVYFDPACGPDSAERTEVRRLANLRGGFTRYQYRSVLSNAINLRNVPRSELEQLRSMPGVLRIVEDRYHPDLVQLDEATLLVGALQEQLSAALLPFDGSGVRVCILDTGIDMDHPMFAERIDAAASWDFDHNDPVPDDDHGHGTHVAGIAVGRTGYLVDHGCEGTEPLQGMAPGATLIGGKVLDAFGGGQSSDIIAGIDHCADQSASGGRADVINMSLGTGEFADGDCDHPWADAANAAVAAGVVVVTSAGNSGFDNALGTPACGADVIAVGATYKSTYPNCEKPVSEFEFGPCVEQDPVVDQIACFSNNSDFIDVTAPGVDIVSADADDGGIIAFSGTSMASPMVAGLAALILEADPALTPAQVRQIIRDGAIDLGPPGFDRAYGYGRIDAQNSLSLIAPCGGDADCDDGQFCNGAETCGDDGRCTPAAPSCDGGPCDEATSGCPQLIQSWDMNSNPGWQIQGDWQYGRPLGKGGDHGGPDPTAGATGLNVVGYRLQGDYPDDLPETHVTTTAIDCTGLTGVRLRFLRWLNVEQPLYDHAYVRVSNDGVDWVTVWENTSQVTDSAWSQQELDLSSIADDEATVFVRWTQGSTDDSWRYSGWNIDDVQVFASPAGPSCGDGVLNQDEARIDCGGPCVACECVEDAACSNDLYCDGEESCNDSGHCQPGSPVTCDDGLFCNGTETCDAIVGCQAGQPITCDDGVDCTVDSCSESVEGCVSVPDHAVCSDGVFCNGAETCDASLGCVTGQSACPVGCDEAADACVECSFDLDCDDGLFCNGAETCDGASCQPGAAPCEDEPCDESADSCGSAAGAAVIWMSFSSQTQVPGVGSVADEDVVAYDPSTGSWSMVFDGSDVGLIPLRIDGLARMSSGDLLLSFADPGNLFGLIIDDSDVVRFTPGSLGASTSGTFSLYFDGSDVGLTTNAEDVDAIALDEAGRLVLSTNGSFSANGGSGEDEDLWRFDASSLGGFTSGSFQILLDGSDVGLGNSGGEDVDAVSLSQSGSMSLSTSGGFSVPGASGSDEDVLAFAPTSTGSSTTGSFSMQLDLSGAGISAAADIGSLEIVE